MRQHVVPPAAGRDHDLRSDCWCRPDLFCAHCEALTPGPCLHGAPGDDGRNDVVVHREAS